MARTWHAATSIGIFAKGEKPDPLLVTFTDTGGVALDLTGFTASCKIEQVDSSTTGLATGTAVLNNAAGGIVQYTFTDADMNTAGLFRLQVWVGNGTRRYASELFEYKVSEDTEAPSL